MESWEEKERVAKVGGDVGFFNEGNKAAIWVAFVVVVFFIGMIGIMVNVTENEGRDGIGWDRMGVKRNCHCLDKTWVLTASSMGKSERI